jgi:hypothetical protein
MREPPPLTEAEVVWLRDETRGDVSIEVVLARHADGCTTRLDLACADILRRHVLPPHVGLKPTSVVEPAPRHLGAPVRVAVRKPRAHCATGKRSYGSAEAAKSAMATASNRVRAYVCETCGTWHITSQAEGRRG